MANVKNNHVAALGVGGVVIAPGRTAAVPAWDRVKDGHAVKVWQELKLLEVTGADANETAGIKPVPAGLPNTVPNTTGLPVPEGSAGLPAAASAPGGVPATGLPATTGNGLPAANAPADEDAQKEAIIAELQKLGVEKTKRSSLATLQADLVAARAK